MRRWLHVASAAVLLLVPLTSWGTFRVVMLSVALAAIGLETARLRFSGARVWVARSIPVFRPKETSQPCGAMWLAVGYGLASLLPAPAPMAGVLVAALADPAASWIGSAGHMTTGKTWRGTSAHLVVATAILALAGFSLAGSLVAATVGTTLERWPGPFNDNVIVPPAVAVSVSLFL